MRNIFISYHHENDQWYKEMLARLGSDYGMFRDCSVGVGDIGEDLSDDAIATKIRDDYLRDTSVTIVLVGQETAGRKHVDWELASSMRNSPRNRQSGILVVELPNVSTGNFWVSYPNELHTIYPWHRSGVSLVSAKTVLARSRPKLPERIMDNLLQPNVHISVVPWTVVQNDPWKLGWLIEQTALYAGDNQYSHRLLTRDRNTPRLGELGAPRNALAPLIEQNALIGKRLNALGGLDGNANFGVQTSSLGQLLADRLDKFGGF
jgi:MTH538 TIR-like domain (DUF1863)